MAEETFWESFKAEGATVVEKLKGFICEGNVRRVRIEHRGTTVAEFPLTAGVIGVILAPMLAAIVAVVALLKDCNIHVERTTAPASAADRAAAKAAGDAEC
jgi:hypothetical protein